MSTILGGELLKIMETEWSDAPAGAYDKVLYYYQELLAGNEIQNLTRLTSPAEFFWGHLWDVIQLLKILPVEETCLDLGSGCGVPGLLAALLRPQPWILTESEKSKAKFLEETVQKLGMEAHVQVFAGRAEAYLKDHRAHVVVSRAVGTIDKLYTWIGPCSTWNTLILFKGPSWDEEWISFGAKKKKFKLREKNAYPARTPKDPTQEATRVLVILDRVR